MNSYSRTILIVDDEETDRMFIERAFRDNGVDSPIRSVSDGYEAITYLMGEGQYSDREKSPFPSFITIDLKMPRADGFTVLEHIKSNPQWAIIPTIVLTASEDPDDIKKSYLLGASAYHVKPGNYQDLCKQLEILHDYWTTCRIPEVDITGRLMTTQSKGKLGERFPQPTGGEQERKKHD